MSNYTKNTNFTAKDNLTSGDPAKVIKGAEFDTEFNALQTAVNSKADSNNSQLTGTTDAQAVETTGDVTVGGNLSVTGNATIEGNLTFGNADTDTVSFVADVDSSIIPDDDNTYDLGSATKQWRNVYVDGTANIDSLVADTADINGGTIDGVSITGTTASFSGEISANGGIALGDNDRAKFGAGDDLQIYHDGSNSYIGEFGTGDLKIRSNKIRMEAPDSQNMIIVTEDEGVQAFYNGAERFSVTSTGVDVTGTVTADGLTVDGTIELSEGNALRSSGELVVRRSSNQIRLGSGNVSDSTSVYAGAQKRITAATNGDISFYEDTGTTAKMVWSSSAESLGIGGSPSSKLTVDGGTSAFSSSGIKIKRTGVLTGSSDFLLAGVSGSEALTVRVNETERMRIDSSGSVGIGTAGPVAKLDVLAGGDQRFLVSTVSDDVSLSAVNGANTAYQELFINGSTLKMATGGTERARIDSSGNMNLFGVGSQLDFETTNGGQSNTIRTVNDYDMALYCGRGSTSKFTLGTDTLKFETSGSERARIDGSGNLLVGTTDSNPSDNSTQTSADNGFAVDSNGKIKVAQWGGDCMKLNRTGTDGNIAQFLKNGSPVGSIGTVGGDLTIGTGDTGVRFDDGTDQIYPVNGTTTRDAAVSLGWSGGRFKDLYLSGGVYLGGTGSDNKLDDYEVGVFSPNALATFTVNNCSYTKIGRMVMLNIDVTCPASSSGTAIQLGVPFTPSGNTYNGSGTISYTDNRTDIQSFEVVNSTGRLQIRRGDDGHASFADCSGNRVIGSVVYEANA